MRENKVQQFLNDAFGEVRVFKDQNEGIWFHANDCLKILEYKESGWNTKISRLNKNGVTKCKGIDSMGRQQLSNYINEPNLYVLVFGSKMAKAEEFQNWITGTVIPSIRKDGAYIQGEEEFKNNELSEDEFILQAMNILQSKVERLKKENERMKPKAEYHDTVLNSDNLLTVSEIAKDLGMSARKLNTILHDNGVQFKQSGTWMLYSKYQDLIKEGLCDYKVTEHGQQLKWTEKGRKFIIDLVNKAS